jgi:predicted dehydrogenase
VNTRLAVGLIGVGGFGATHLKALQQLEAEGLVRLVSVADPDGERLAGPRRALEARNIRWHTDYRSLLERETDLDAVAVAAPIHLHQEITEGALARDLFVYLEKPPVPLVQQLNELIATDVQRGVVVGFQLIHSHPVQQLKQWRTQGALGDIQSIRVHGCSPRSPAYYARTPWAGKMVFDGKPVFDGPATNALSHWLHNIMYLGTARPNGFDLPTEIEAELYRVKSIESYDTICMRGRLETGADFQYVVTHATDKAVPCKLEIIGSKGRAWIVESRANAWNNLGLSESARSCADPFLESWRQFVRFVRAEQPRAATRLEDTRGYVLATNAALASSGGIHGISQTSGDGGQDTRGFDLLKLVEHSAREGTLFSQMKADWGRSGKPIELATWLPSIPATGFP